MSLIGWFEVCETFLLYPNLIYKTLEKFNIINNHLQTAYSRKKFYANHMKWDLEYEEGNKMYLKFFPMKGVVRYGKKE